LLSVPWKAFYIHIIIFFGVGSFDATLSLFLNLSINFAILIFLIYFIIFFGSKCQKIIIGIYKGISLKVVRLFG